MNNTHSNKKEFLKSIFYKKEIAVLIGIIIIVIIFGSISPVFFTTINILNMLRATSQLGILSLGVLVVMLTGELDFSVGSVVSLSGMILGVLIGRVGLNNWLALLIALLIGVFFGFLHGILVVKAKVPSFIVTLGTSMVYSTLSLVICGGIPVTNFKEANFFNVFSGRIRGIPIEIIWLAVLSLIFYFLLTKMNFGYHVFAIGGNIKAAKICGINTDKIKIISFIMSTVLAVIAGAVSMSYLMVSSPETGSGMELFAITAVVIGGATLSGGQGSVFGALLGVLLIGILRNGFIMLGLPSFYQTGFIGIVLIAAIMFQSMLSDKKI